jgi:acyl carrier protein
MSEQQPTICPDTQEGFVRELIEFIKGPLIARHGPRQVDVDASTPLFETGIIDSLGIIDLLLFVETITGRQVPMRKVDMRFFGTVDRISNAFWTDRERL